MAHCEWHRCFQRFKPTSLGQYFRKISISRYQIYSFGVVAKCFSASAARILDMESASRGPYRRHCFLGSRANSCGCYTVETQRKSHNRNWAVYVCRFQLARPLRSKSIMGPKWANIDINDHLPWSIVIIYDQTTMYVMPGAEYGWFTSDVWFNNALESRRGRHFSPVWWPWPWVVTASLEAVSFRYHVSIYILYICE